MKIKRSMLSVAIILLAIAGSVLIPPYKSWALGIERAKNFSIKYFEKDIKIVTDSEGRDLLLVPKGVDIPAAYKHMTVVRTPLERAFFTSTSYIGFLGKLGREHLYDSVAAVCTPVSDWTIPAIIEKMQNGEIKYIEKSHTAAPDIESVIKLKPDIVFSGGGDISGIKLQEQLDEANIKYAVILDYTESGNGAYLEWIKFFAAFYNLDKEAEKIYNDTIHKMDILAQKVADMKASKRPVVALGLLFNGVIYTQGGNSEFSRTVDRAGGIYALKGLDAEGSVQIGMEEFFEKCRGADILIYTSSPKYMPSKQALIATHELFSEFKAVKDGQVYIYDNGYYMNAAALDEKFEDLVFMLIPQLMPQGYTMRHYRRLE